MISIQTGIILFHLNRLVNLCTIPKSQGFEYEEAGKTSKATLYNVYDDDGDFVAGCMMSELRSDPVLFITSSE